MQTTTEILKLIREWFGTAFMESLVRETVFLNDVLGARIRSGSEVNQKSIQWKVNYSGNASVGSYAENDSLGTAGEQAFDTAELSWAQNKMQARASGLSIALGDGPNSIVKTMAMESELGLKDLKRNLNLQLLSDGIGHRTSWAATDPALQTGGTDITGILAGIDDGSKVATYAGISRAANMWWQSYVLANGGVLRPLSETLMQQVINALMLRNGGTVTHILCDPDTWTSYGALLKADRRINDPAGKYTGGFKTLDFNGIPVVNVPGYAPNRMDFIDINLIEYHILLDFAVEPRDPGNYDAEHLLTKHYSQLVVRDPWHMGSARDLAT